MSELVILLLQGRRCNLFYDIEYYKDFNKDLDGDTLVDTVLSMTEELCRKMYGTGI